MASLLAQQIPTDHADLHDICFVEDHAWAVGDQGVIWHSADQGKTWGRQPTPEMGHLRDVFFLDPQHGWVLGFTADVAGQVRGLLWQTENGGQQWTIRPVPLMSAMAGLLMADTQHGWAWGSPSASNPSGLFRTTDGGRNWSGVPGTAASPWSAGAADGQGGIVVAGRGAAFARVGLEGPLQAEPLPDEVDLSPSASRVLLPLDRTAWLVAREQGGLDRVAQQQWESLPNLAVDLYAGCRIDQSLFLAGYPGHVIYRRQAGDDTWHAIATGQRLPIFGMAFATPSLGCCVTALGNILRTNDGGATWQRVLGTHDRVALLAIVSQVGETPWDLLADAASGEYLSRAVVWTEPSELRDQVGPAYQAACLRVGATGGAMWDRWRLPRSGLPLPWHALRETQRDGSATMPVEPLARQLADALRVWHPEAIATVSSPYPESVTGLTEQAVLQAIHGAEQERPDRLDLPRLAGWRTREVWVGAASNDPAGSLRISRQQIRPAYADTVGVAVASARWMISDRNSRDSQVDMALFRRIAPPAVGQGPRQLFSHADLARGAPGRLPAAAAPFANPQEWQTRLATQRNAHALLNQLISQDDAPAAGWERMIQAADPLHPLDAGTFLYRLAHEYQRRGRSDLAVTTLRELVRSAHYQGVSHAALDWLWVWETSAETAHRRKSTQHTPHTSVPIPPALVESPASPPATAPEPVNKSGLPWVTQLLRETRKRYPASEADPQKQLSYIAWLRPQDADQASARLAGVLVPQGSPWALAVATERAVTTQRGVTPLPRRSATLSSQRPRLDGQLDEPLWSSAAVFPLMGFRPASTDATRLLLTGDQEYLYLGVEAPRVADVVYQPPTRDRGRDPDLRETDRVEIEIDTNRDYASAWRLTLNYRGWTGESLLGDATWNPTWYVASGGDETTWRVEAAIPWKELADTPPLQSPWLVSIARVVPGYDVMHCQPALQLDTEFRGFNLFDVRP